MGYRYYDYEEKRLQRKLIPLNLFVAILCLVAAISLMVTPFIQIDAAKFVAAISEMEQGGSPSDSEDGAEAVEDETTAAIMSSIKGKIGISPIFLAKVTFAPDDEAKTELLAKELFLDNGLFDSFMSGMANVMLVTAIAENVELPEGVNYETLQTALEKFDSVKDKAEFETVVDDYVKELETQMSMTFDDDVKEAIAEYRNKLWDETVAETDGEFSVESMICVFASKSMGEDAPVVTTYAELFEGVIDGSIASPGGEGLGNIVARLTEKLSLAFPYFPYAFYACCGFAGIWLILFLFSFFHMFARNKRFTMWYVKIFGGIPCLLCGVLFKVIGIPSVATAIIGMVPEVATMLPVLAAISTMTWISGVCYLLLWLVSIFWAFPIKHKIRKLRR